MKYLSWRIDALYANKNSLSCQVAFILQPQNAGIVKSRICAVDSESRKVLAEANANAFEYRHRIGKKNGDLTYTIVAVDAARREGGAAYAYVKGIS